MSEPSVTITIPLDQSKAISDGMSDLLCWCAGFRAARNDDTSSCPMGVEDARTMRIHLNAAIDKAEGRTPQPLPF